MGAEAVTLNEVLPEQPLASVAVNRYTPAVPTGRTLPVSFRVALSRCQLKVSMPCPPTADPVRVVLLPWQMVALLAVRLTDTGVAQFERMSTSVILRFAINLFAGRFGCVGKGSAEPYPHPGQAGFSRGRNRELIFQCWVWVRRNGTGVINPLIVRKYLVLIQIDPNADGIDE